MDNFNFLQALMNYMNQQNQMGQQGQQNKLGHQFNMGKPLGNNMYPATQSNYKPTMQMLQPMGKPQQSPGQPIPANTGYTNTANSNNLNTSNNWLGNFLPHQVNNSIKPGWNNKTF